MVLWNVRDSLYNSVASSDPQIYRKMPGKDVEYPVEDMSAEDLQSLYSEVGVTREGLSRDAVVLREWVNTQPHLPNLTSEHDEWLKMFIIVSKNLMERAKERIDSYFTTRAVNSDWFKLPPPNKEYLMFTKEREYLYNTNVPKLLPGGYGLFFEKVRPRPNGDFSELDFEMHFQRPVLIMESFVASGKPLRGVVLVLDLEHVTLSYFTAALPSLGMFRRAVQCVQDAQPLRIHTVHLINVPAASTLKVMLSAFLPLLKDKLSERIFVHETMDSFHDHVPKKYLPSDYDGALPDSLDDCMKSLNNFLKSRREWFDSRQWMKADETKRVNKLPSIHGLEGSFRKLDVD